MAIEIQEWEIWHTYTTYLECDKIDLRETARRLVASGIAECAMLKDGLTYWRSNGKVESGSTVVNGDSVRGQRKAELRLHKGGTAPVGFASEAWFQASCFLSSERKLMPDDSEISFPYLRAFLGKCVLSDSPSEDEKSQLSLYPVLIIYESGVSIVEFRMIGPEATTPLVDFIDWGVNLFRYKFSRILVSPGLASFAPRAGQQFAYQRSFLRRLQFRWLQAGHDIAVRQQTTKETDDPFCFDLAPLSTSEPDDLKSVAMTIFQTAAYVAGRQRSGIAFPFRGRFSVPNLGQFWSGRPHIHLLRFRNQGTTTAENEDRFGPDFGRILIRISGVADDDARPILPKSARLFQDYGAYILSNSSLWVWSLNGLSQQTPQMDPNRGNLIYERQVLVEFLEHGYMLHRKLYHRVQSLRASSTVIAARREIVTLRRYMREASYAGEIRELLRRGWKEFGLPGLVSDIEALLTLRESETRSLDAVRATRVGWALTIVFGFVAVPTLADQVVEPLWKLTPFHQFANASMVRIVSDGISVLLVLAVLWVTLFVLSLRED